MTAQRAIAAALLAVAAAFGAGRLPAAVIPPQVALLVEPLRHRPKRGPSRDRLRPGKARRRARRTP